MTTPPCPVTLQSKCRSATIEYDVPTALRRKRVVWKSVSSLGCRIASLGAIFDPVTVGKVDESARRQRRLT